MILKCSLNAKSPNPTPQVFGKHLISSHIQEDNQGWDGFENHFKNLILEHSPNYKKNPSPILKYLVGTLDPTP